MKLDRLISIIPAVLFCLTVVYLLVFPIRTLEYQDRVLGVTTPSVRPGESIPLTIHYCKYTDLPETITGQMVSQDGERISKPLVVDSGEITLQRNLERGCHAIHSEIWHAPTSSIPGHTYVATFTVQYHPNAFHTITKHSTSAPFLVQKEGL